MIVSVPLAPSVESTPVIVTLPVVPARVPLEPLTMLMIDELLDEARLTYRLRDERGVYSDIWAPGIMRRAALGAGRRTARRGRLASPQQMLDASLDEMCAVLCS